MDFGKRYQAILLAGLLCAPLAAQPQRAPTSGLKLYTTTSSAPLRPFLNRGAWPGYWNLGKQPFSPTTTSVRSSELYDRLGSHLFPGYPLLSWRETRSDQVGLQESGLLRENYFFDFFNNMMVASDSYRGWNLSLTIGDAIRTSLSPLTVRLPRWQGLRFDGETKSQGFTALLTRGSEQRFSGFDSPGKQDLSPVLAYGGHYLYRPNEVLTLGATLFNQHQVDVESKQGSFISGTQPYQIQAPKRISVWIESDEGGSAAGVYDVDIELVLVAEDGSRIRVSSDDTDPAEVYRPSLEPGAPVRGQRVGDLYQARADEVVEYIFDLPQGERIVSAVFRADVAGDYRISVRQAHDFTDLEAGTTEERHWPSAFPDFVVRGVVRPGHAQRSNLKYPFDFKPVEDDPHTTVARAPGSPGMDRRRTVRFDYGIPSGKTLIGTDFKLAARELMAEGEIVYSSEEGHFPFSDDNQEDKGRKHTSGSWAYLFNARRPVSLLGVGMEAGGEVFRMDPDYSGGYDSRRGGTIFFTDKGGANGTEAFTQEFPLMADNDDDDEYVDDSFNDQGRFQYFVPSGNYSGGRTGGVFPGLDEDGDLSPDNDKDRNAVPDWTEPFLLYDSDPASFAYGIDFNNNGRPDFRENDDHPDYPIRKDQEGYHAFLSLLDRPGLGRTSLGYYRMSEIAGAGEAKALYARMESSWLHHSGFGVEFNDDVKLVEDDVSDNVYEWVTGDTSSFANVYSVINPPPPDPLVMRKSIVNTAFVRLSYRPTSAFGVRTDVLHFVNRQRELQEAQEIEETGELEDADVLVQEGNTFSELAVISRAEYRVFWNKLEFWAGVKYGLQEGRRGQAWDKASTRLFAPIFKTTYEIMDGIELQWGMSGMPLLPMRLTDNEDETRSYKERKMVLMLIGRSDNYEGANVGISVGLELHRKNYKKSGRELDFDTYATFVEIVVGN
ncbi:MAG: hypothetical protein VCC04_00120 [Myxococcota bacterium]